ncbi:MAG: UDP-N-acetylmuramoyl-L-alanyl-D-glutamate--2,6-diaminopimelate ligase [Bacteroidetes bacterium]|nr:UDP-N-acetylmuramoyl-L-alanyl-D-glutamate--2,6-diaminopimelate ligase [Bacteroidota bacterium]HET6245581.1 UDP-N-acetylmuramoyl-L-alanyl-D-glutamate--2,6-diaminopimelate ligase [Bacteroidia bacterium]
MKLLKDILYKAGLIDVAGSTNIAISSVAFDSRTVERDGLFVAVVGVNVDGHHFIDQAIAKGAVAVVCQEMPSELKPKISYIKVKDAALALSYIASNFYDNPSSSLNVIGVTGTNGKTTTVTLLYNLFLELGHKTGLLSTVVNKIGKETIEATHTTPDALQLNALLRKMVDSGCKYCFMEISSHAIVQHRTTGLTFAGGIFTNITHDHLDYHKTFDEYIKAKKGFFDMLPENAFALINRDDKHSGVMVQNSKARKKTYSLFAGGDYKAKIIESQLSGMMLNIDGQELWVKLIGSFNAYNVLAVYGTAMLLNQDKLKVMTAISALESVEGRFEYLKSKNNITAVVDYAHTPDALLNVLKTIKEIRTGNEQVITVVGCGGDRDAAKRPLMAEIACDFSDKVILTSDNPRSEEPDAIISDMKKGINAVNFKKALAITDRKEAIKTACTFAKPGDIILVAGKGHEKYQEIKGIKHPFDDLEVIKDTFIMLQYN